MYSKMLLEKFSNNLNMLIAAHRTSASEIARATGIPPTTIKRYRSNRNSNPTLLSLIPLANYFSTTIGQLLGEEKLTSIPSELMPVPLLNWSEIFYFLNDPFFQPMNSIFTELGMSKKAFSVKITTDEFPTLPVNTYLFVEPDLIFHSGDLVVIINIKTNLVALKKIIIEDEIYYLQSLVPGILPVKLNKDQEITGVVVQFKNNLRN